MIRFHDHGVLFCGNAMQVRQATRCDVSVGRFLHESLPLNRMLVNESQTQHASARDARGHMIA